MIASSVDAAEIEKFSRIAAEWWDPFGKFKPLHKFNPIRLAIIRDHLCSHFGRDATARAPLQGLRLLDVGCGGGLVAEPMARLGATVIGIDAAARNIGTARVHAAQSGLSIDYEATTVEALLASGTAPFDVVLNLEVVEHVADVGRFLTDSAHLVAPGGVMVVATINRTLKALATAKIAAEYVLRWLPAGTHDPRKFVRPAEVTTALEAAGLNVRGTSGVAYQLMLDAWRETSDLSVNYMVFAARA